MDKEKIINWEERNKQLSREMATWREDYLCKNNCYDWKRYKFCKHLVDARERKFKKEINQQIGVIMGAIN